MPSLASAALLEFRVLGPVAALASGCPVAPGEPRHQRTLAVLLTAPNRVIATSRLVRALWGDVPPATARTQVQICVSALRRGFRTAGVTQQVILTRGDGYQLQVDDEALDATVFQTSVDRAAELARQGARNEAVLRLRAALAMWQGAAYGGAAGPVLAQAAARLDEQRLTSLEDCLELHLALGNEREVLAELRGLVEEYPFRERLLGAFMVALYRNCRRVEALDQFRRFRQMLAAELGLDPGSALRRLHADIMRGALT